MTDPMTDTDKADLPARVLSTLKAKLMEAGADSNRLINALDEFGDSIIDELIPEIKKKVFLPYEIEKAILETKLENEKREACLYALKSIDRAICFMNTQISEAENKFSRDLRERLKNE